MDLMQKHAGKYVAEEVEIKTSRHEITLLRNGWRSVLLENQSKPGLIHDLAGQIPYFYRNPSRIAADFAA
jgi:CCR4-NOT transcriptional regulation complex NOT5 subunit